MPLQISIDRGQIAAFCRRWKIRELAVFGSVLRDDFRPDSDVDVLVSYEPDADWGLLEHVAMQDELSEMIGRRVELVSRRAVERSANPLRKRAILETANAVAGWACQRSSPLCWSKRSVILSNRSMIRESSS